MRSTYTRQKEFRMTKTSSAPPFRLMICGHTHIVAILLAVVLSLSIGILAMADSSLAQTGTTDPAADYQMWRDDEIFLPFYQNSYSKLTSTSYEYNPDDKTLSKPTYCNPAISTNTQMSAAAGRIMSPYYDQVIYASIFNVDNLIISFADKCDLVTGLPIGIDKVIGPQTNMPSVGTVTNLPRFYDITTGDLDKHIDANQDYRDEVVVAYAGDTGDTNFSLIIAVLEYTESSVVYPFVYPTVTWMSIEDAIPRDIVSIYNGYAAIPLAVSTGDFDGDTHKEIAVAYLNSTLTVGVAVFRYTTTEDDEGVLTHSLNLVHSITSSADIITNFNPTRFIGSIDTAAGDFDGNGKDELSVSASVSGQGSFPAAVDMKMFRFNDDLFITEVAPNTTATIISCPWKSTDLGVTDIGVQIVAGLFKFVPDPDPLKDYGLSRRQLVLAIINPKRETLLWAIVYDSNLVPYNFSSFMPINTYSANFSMAAGGFNGLRTAASPESPDDVVWSLACSWWNEFGQTLWLEDFMPEIGFFGGQSVFNNITTIGNTSKTSIVPLVAYDHGLPKLITKDPDTTVLAGDSMYLGAPLHMVLEGAYTFDYILQEPPKHVYWDPELKTIVNISGKDAFTVGTTDKQEIDVTNSSKDNTDKSWGVSESLSGTISFAGGLIRPPKLEGTLSETVGYDYKEHDATYDKDMEQRTVALSHNADRDDALRYRIQNIDVWRYYVYGANFEDLDDNPMVGFMDITMPGTVEELITSGMAECDVYQPVHENNNILSYPSPTTSGKYDPPDMGSFQVQCTDLSGDTCDKDPETGDPLLTQTINGALVDQVTWTWGGTSGTQEWSDSRSETKGKERTTSKTLTSSQDIKGTMRINIPEARLKISGSLDIAAHESWSWSESSTMETTTSQLTSIKLNIPTGNSSESYHFYPVFYVATDGTMKVSFAVDPMTENSELTWKKLYGDNPDPALNLPNRFKATTENQVTVWYPNMADNRKLIRGFFVRQSEADEVTGEYTEYSGPPSADDVVRLECRVYNYSTGQSVTDLKVRFEYVEIDQASGQEIGTRKSIIDDGTLNDYTTIPSIAPRGMETAAVNWLIPSFSDSESKDYKIYVVLDPDNDISNEKYETESAETRTYCPDGYDCIDPGQNNEGWRKMTVLASLPNDPRYERPTDVHLKSDALAAINPRGKLVTTTVQAYERRPLKIRVRIDTDYAGADSAHLLLFDGDPYDGKLIANSLSYTGDPDGNYVWIEWVPTELGLHRLYAKVVESTLDTNLGNNISDELKVVVIKAPQRHKKAQGPKKAPRGPKK